MSDRFTLKYRCTACDKEVRPEEAGFLRCPYCNTKWTMSQGIADLGGDIPYYGELPRERVKAVVQEARERGWKRALIDNFHRPHNFLYRIAAYETRADWLYLLDLGREDSVLDVGSGWGTEAIPLARNTGFVAAMDGTMERLEFLMVRAGQEKVDNITGVRGSILDPPLMPGQFDLVVLNGVLEWMGTADTTSNPRELQRLALKNVYNLLKRGGRLYLGIENSHGFKYLLGEPDDHTGLRNISFLPREKADKLMRAKMGTDYRTYTYSYSGYETLLKEAGFGRLDFYYPIPDYKLFTVIAPLGKGEPYRYYMENLNPDSEPGTLPQNIKNLECAALEEGKLADHVSSYSIVAEKA